MANPRLITQIRIKQREYDGEKYYQAKPLIEFIKLLMRSRGDKDYLLDIREVKSAENQKNK